MTRPAEPADADEILRLRIAVRDGGPLTEHWQGVFRDDLRARLGTDPDLLAYVVPADGGLVACAIGLVHRGYRGPAHPTGRWGRIHTVATDPLHQRRGHGRAATTALVEALKDAGCGSVELRATEAGAGLYRALGFEPVGGFMALRPGPGGWVR